MKSYECIYFFSSKIKVKFFGQIDNKGCSCNQYLLLKVSTNTFGIRLTNEKRIFVSIYLTLAYALCTVQMML